MTPNSTAAGRKVEMSGFARRATEPKFGMCASRGLEIRCLQLQCGHHGGRTNVDPSSAKAQPVYYRSIIEKPLSLMLLGEQPFWVCVFGTFSENVLARGECTGNV
jgi:hypothetical protein